MYQYYCFDQKTHKSKQSFTDTINDRQPTCNSQQSTIDNRPSTKLNSVKYVDAFDEVYVSYASDHNKALGKRSLKSNLLFPLGISQKAEGSSRFVKTFLVILSEAKDVKGLIRSLKNKETTWQFDTLCVS